MSSSGPFHDVLFPTRIALGASGGPERRTEIVALGSGREARNARWACARRRFDAGYGIKSLNDLYEVIEFFEERRGRLYGFRFKDRSDWKSCPPADIADPRDQVIGTGDGATTAFQLSKTYGGLVPHVRPVTRPIEGSVRIAVDGVELASGGFTIDTAGGLVTLTVAPESDAVVTAGFQFDVPVRFDSDRLVINLSHFDAGDIPSIPIVEILE
ncbi:hypothetical protein HDIA_1348 [Hartmannibacter diazotrophicus]|uniref:DUF2460 domain-containing protein n=1 Tax=Hartmannibacter diazotrophicus TaxID=1482074 RepID=A0A2C9D3Y1_9HYPH|nr:DUF2460 domain-containing protein [Hartmannibacter diazotrophicus]SON54889.1 hypothetical protein HDIA_1348 [Hartmannibacter diazotrophicus]